jgi:hypothetical protein
VKNSYGDPTKLSIFLGSPKRDLENIRLRILQAILDAGHIPDGMELWAADARPTLQVIREKLKLCDVHVVVLGHRYGEILSRQKIGFTEWEYRQSKEAKRPVISFLLQEEAVKEAWKKNSPSKAEKELYWNFREELIHKSICQIYPNQRMPRIDTHVTNALNQVVDGEHLRALPGWIRQESKAARVAAALQGNHFLMRIMERVISFKTTGSRIDTESRAKHSAAELFWDSMKNQLIRTQFKSIFLESGSSVAYVSESIEKDERVAQGWKIATNNALALLQLLLFTDGEVRRSPSVSPDPTDPYGAIFTKRCLDAYEEPPVKPRGLYRAEKDAIDEIVGLLKSGREKQVILASASGWDTTHRIAAFHGPHVGSHANMLFKRAIFMTGQPVILFLSRHKVDPRFPEARFKCRLDEENVRANTHYCYPVFGKELPLARALKDTPVALCIGYQSEKQHSHSDVRDIRDEIKALLAPHLGPKFNMDYSAKEFDFGDGLHSGALMLANEKFCKLFPK